MCSPGDGCAEEGMCYAAVMPGSTHVASRQSFESCTCAEVASMLGCDTDTATAACGPL